MSEALLLTLSYVLNTALPYWVVGHDLKRLSDERLMRAWPEASFLSAVFAFGPLSILVHFTRTRRSWAGFGLGLGLCALTLGLQALIVGGFSAILGVA